MSIRIKWDHVLPLLQVGASLRMEPEGRWWEDAFQGVISKLQPEVRCRETGCQCAPCGMPARFWPSRTMLATGCQPACTCKQAKLWPERFQQAAGQDPTCRGPVHQPALLQEGSCTQLCQSASGYLFTAGGIGLRCVDGR